MPENISPIELQKALSGIDYPADRDDLVQRAKDNRAPDEVVNFLEQIPNRQYDGPSGVSQEISDQNTNDR